MVQGRPGGGKGKKGSDPLASSGYRPGSELTPVWGAVVHSGTAPYTVVQQAFTPSPNQTAGGAPPVASQFQTATAGQKTAAAPPTSPSDRDDEKQTQFRPPMG